ncbi:MFS transporter [Nocardiopsis ganjiahuensis]|uniref:MFS transporter n=1 Tax=Nocardiopsis ganjiahuensis TaxID=239984 RepID=UPI000344A649|nr:MFS transporter [Nocardiopsis ganjiahuensis]
MKSPAEGPPSNAAPARPPHARRWLALAVLAGSQLLIVLDATVVNVALTAIRADLDLSVAELQWTVTFYVLAFGGFLLLGGRLADRYGRRRMFIASAAVFGLGSLLAGYAHGAAVLFAGRALQGLAAAVLAPAALSLLMTVFPEGRDRHRALAVWGGVSAGGTALGLILGGVLTQALSWHWVFWVNVPIVMVAVPAARFLLPEARSKQPERFDVAGALLGTAGVLGLVYGLVTGAENGLVPALPVMLVSLALLGAFARMQSVRPHALVPIRLLRNRTLVGADAVGLILAASLYSLFYFLSLFMGGVLGYGPVATGLAFLPMTIAIAAASAGAASLLPRLGIRPVLVISVLLVAVAFAGLTRIDLQSSYPGTLLPPLLLVGVGLGLAFVALTAAAVGSASPGDSGIAAALFNAGQQIGAALGLAALTAVSAIRTSGLTPPGSAEPTTEAVVRGWSLGFSVAAVFMLAGLLVIMTTMKPRDP